MTPLPHPRAAPALRRADRTWRVRSDRIFPLPLTVVSANNAMSGLGCNSSLNAKRHGPGAGRQIMDRLAEGTGEDIRHNDPEPKPAQHTSRSYRRQPAGHQQLRNAWRGGCRQSSNKVRFSCRV
jgi:hypothetical protein